MKNFYALSLICLFLLSACGGGIVSAKEGGTPLATKAANTSIPATPTIGYQATANVAMTAERAAQLTAESANIAVAQITAQADQMKLERQRIAAQEVQITAQAEMMELEKSKLLLTAAPVTATAEQGQRVMAAMRITQEAAYPTIVRANAENENYIKYGANVEAGKIFLIWVSVFLVLLACVFIFIKLIQEGTRPPLQIVDLNEAEPEPAKPVMHFQPTDTPGVTRRVNPDVPCTIDELQEFAEGLLRLNKTMAFGQWEGTPVHKRLKDLREWMEFNRLSVPIPGYTNEYMPTPSGLKFLQFALDNGTTPAPYVCMDETREEAPADPEEEPNDYARLP